MSSSSSRTSATELLDQLYSYNATIPAMLFFIRKMRSEKTAKAAKEEKNSKITAAHITKTMLDITEMLCSVPMEEFEAKNRKYLYDAQQCDFLNKKRDRISLQLEEVRKMDRQLTDALINMEQKISDLRSKKEDAQNLVYEIDNLLKQTTDFSTNQQPNQPSGLENLFSSDSFFGFPPEPPPLVRQVASFESLDDSIVLSDIASDIANPNQNIT